MDFRYDYQVNNRMLSIYDGVANKIYTTRNFHAIGRFHGFIGWAKEKQLDNAISEFLNYYSKGFKVLPL